MAEGNAARKGVTHHCGTEAEGRGAPLTPWETLLRFESQEAKLFSLFSLFCHVVYFFIANLHIDLHMG